MPTARGDAQEFEEDDARRATVVGKRSAMAGERPAATDSEDASGAASALEARRARFDETSPAEKPESPAFARGRRRAPRPGLLRGRTPDDSRPDRGDGDAARLGGPSRPSSWEQMPQRRGQGPLASAKSLDRGRSQRRQDALVAPRDLLRRRQVDLQEESPAAVASVYGNRSGLARLEALKSGGGSEETEAAVLAGLRYLAKVQRRTGAWGRATDDDKYGDVRVGKSSLALLAFLGSGYTHEEDGEFRKTVRSGLQFILGQQNKRSGHIGEGSAYSHGIATYALAEAYAMTEDRSLRQPLFLAVQRIRTAQLARGDRKTDGGWSYYYEDQERRYDAWPRMSVTVWQIMALESARISGIKIPDRVFERARRFVVRSWDRRLDSFRYNHDPEWLRSRYPTLPGSSAAAIFALQLLGEDGAEAEVRAGVRSLMQKLPTRRWRRASSDDFVRRGAGNEYYLYYATLALRMRGGANWKRWNDRLKPLLLESQQSNGSWRPISHYAEYARDTDRDRSYTTAMNVLMLEIYYRYDTPLLRKLAQQVQKKRPESAGPRVVVDEVEAQTVAYRAGLRNEDVILSIADTPVATFEELRRVNRSITPAMRLRVKVRRGARQIELEFSGPLEGFTIREEE